MRRVRRGDVCQCVCVRVCVVGGGGDGNFFEDP